MPRCRIGAVSYLNTKPLVYGLDSYADRCEVIYDLPSRLADRLAAGDLDVALIPSIEAALNPAYTIVSDACIGCRGPVWSVKLLSKVEPALIGTLALDEGSRTSAALIKILLAEKFKIHPEFQQLPIQSDWKEVETDAVLVIGDRAMLPSEPPFTYEWDLGNVWNEWTGLPFVFAMWAAASSEFLNQADWLLTQSRNEGLCHLQAIADANADTYNLTQAECRKYLAEHLHFHLGTDEKKSLERYYQLAAQHNLIPNNIKLNFHECQATR